MVGEMGAPPHQLTMLCKYFLYVYEYKISKTTKKFRIYNLAKFYLLLIIILNEYYFLELMYVI
jgi:hypothetical protein